MKNFAHEFKAFAIKGNVVDLAVAVIIGTAFGKIVSSLVDTILMPIISIFLGGVDFSGLSLGAGKVMLKYGVFLQSVVDFIIIAFVIFMVVQAINRVKKTHEEVKAEAAPAVSEEVKLLSEIRDLLKKNS